MSSTLTPTTTTPAPGSTASLLSSYREFAMLLEDIHSAIVGIEPGDNADDQGRETCEAGTDAATDEEQQQEQNDVKDGVKIGRLQAAPITRKRKRELEEVEWVRRGRDEKVSRLMTWEK